MAAARAAYLAGFASTSNLEAGRRYGIPTAGTAAHAFTLLHDVEAAAFAAQVAALGAGTTLLVDTYDITQGIRTAVEVAGPELGAVRIDSGDLGVLARAGARAARRARRDRHPDRASPATWTSTPSPRCAPSRWTATASARGGHRLRRADGRAWSTSSSRSTAGRWPSAARTRSPTAARKSALRRAQAHRHRGRGGRAPASARTPERRPARPRLPVPLVRGGELVAGLPTLDEAREHLRAALVACPGRASSSPAATPRSRHVRLTARGGRTTSHRRVPPCHDPAH